MAITNALNAPRNSYTSTAGQTAFAVGFEFYQVTDVKVYKNGSLMTYNAAPSNTVTYSITGTASAGDSAYEFGGGGSVVFGSGLTNGDVIVIVRDIAVERTVDFNPSSAFDITTLNTQLDTIIGMIADREKQGDRSVKLLDTDIVAATVTLPLKATRASKVLSFDADGNTETTITSTGLSAINSVTSEIGLLGTSANVTAMGLLGNSAVIADMALLGTTDAIADMALLATSDIVSDLNTLATSDIVADLAILATSDIVSDINTLATSDIVSDLNTLATSAIVTDLSILATSDIVTDINLLATSDIVSDLNTLATSDFVSDLNTLASSTVVTNIATVAANVAGVTSFAERYRVTGGDPGSDNDAGDLNYNTSSNALKYWDGSSWNTIASSYSIDTATDTNLTSVADGAMLLYDTDTSKWIDNVMSGDATMADTGVITIANDAVTADKIADSINSAITANTAKVTNATHTGEVTGATSLTIADNAVTLAKMASGTDGNLISYDTSGNPVAVATGSAGQVLTSAGAGAVPSFATPAGALNYVAVTGATPALDVGSYNFFNHDPLTANTTVSFTNVPTVARWTYSYKGAYLSLGTDVITSLAEFSPTKRFAASSINNDILDFVFNNDGTRLFFSGNTGDTIYQVDLSTAYDLATAAYNSVSLSISSKVGTWPRSISFSTDGTKFYVAGGFAPDGNTVEIDQWNLSTAFNLATASAGTQKSIASQGTSPYSHQWKPDGTELYIDNARDIDRYTLSTAWAVNTASYQSTYSPPSGTTGDCFRWNADGTKFFMLATESDYKVKRFSMSTAYNVQTASYDGASHDSPVTSKYRMWIKPDMTEFYFMSSSTFYSYRTTTPATLTLPSSVGNNNNGHSILTKRISYDLFTKDGGTNVVLLGTSTED